MPSKVTSWSLLVWFRKVSIQVGDLIGRSSGMMHLALGRSMKGFPASDSDQAGIQRLQWMNGLTTEREDRITVWWLNLNVYHKAFNQLFILKVQHHHLVHIHTWKACADLPTWLSACHLCIQQVDNLPNFLQSVNGCPIHSLPPLGFAPTLLVPEQDIGLVPLWHFSKPTF